MDIQTHAEIIDAWPSPTELALGLNKFLSANKKVSPGLVRKWKARNSIPPAYWKAFLLLAKEASKNITAETFIDAASSESAA